MKTKTSMILAGAALVSAVAAHAEEVKKVTIEGNERVEDTAVLSYINISSGDEYDPRQSSRIIKNLYNTGLFNNVEIVFTNGELVVEVEENPLVNKVAFEGNDEVVDERFREVISLKPRAVYTPSKVQKDVQTILSYYRQKGFFLTKVNPQMIKRDQNRVDVIYQIEEGQETEIKGIDFVGNERFSDNELKSLIRTKESAWWRLWGGTDLYDPDLVEIDKELLRRHYIQAGYADFNVVSAVAELTKEKDGFFITFTIHEGPSYDFGQIDVRLDAIDEDLDRDEILSTLEVKNGNVYNGALVEEDMEKLTTYLGNKGFAFLDVRPQFRQDEAARTVDVTYDIVPGPRVYVNRINIQGNDRTRDYVLRREMRFSEGDAFSASKLTRSKDRLTYLGFFEDVNVRHQETGIPDKVDIDVNVKEQSTGEFNIGAGFSSYDGPLASAEVKEKNFLGKGQEMNFSMSVSGRRQDFNFGFTEPYFMNKELSAGIDIFNEERDYQDESSYDTKRVGASLRFGVPLTEYARDFVTVGIKKTEITGIDSTASQFIRAEEGEKTAIFLSNAITYDTRDSRLTPTKGFKAQGSLEYSGFGSDIEFLRGRIGGSWHKEIRDDWVFTVAGEAGAIWDINNDIPLYEMFQLGGNNGLRGFDFSGIGPRDATNDDALGGKYMLSNTLELSFPMGAQMKEMGINGLVFADGGFVTEFKENNSSVIDSKTYRASVGIGAYWRSPLGPLRFEFALPVSKAKEDRTKIFSFNFGTRF
ncbi:MAG: outer membrane protein assembly factor BamA [Magnetococcales bacterium]|nr:outer membrane protein assembly factor BamA [Magnetococcales bacterium]